MTRKRAMVNLALSASPWIAVALLVALSMVFPNRNQPSPQAEVRRAQIAKAFAEVPLFINGDWVGRDEVVAQEAPKLLRPNAILSRRYDLTAGELRVLLALIDTGSVAEVARHLGISEGTVRNHLHRLFEKTGTRRQAELVRLVSGLASPLA